MKYKYDASTEIDILLEWTGADHVVDKVSLTTVGLTYGTTFLPYGNGTATYVAAHNLFNFSAMCQFSAGTTQTGPIANGDIFRVYGTYYADTNRLVMI